VTGVWRRAARDTRRLVSRWAFVVILAGNAVFAGIGALIPDNASAGLRVAAAVLGAIGGNLLVGAFVYSWYLVRAPFAQRDEARAAVSALSAPQTTVPLADRLERLAADGRLLARRIRSETEAAAMRSELFQQWIGRATDLITNEAHRYLVIFNGWQAHDPPAEPAELQTMSTSADWFAWQIEERADAAMDIATRLRVRADDDRIGPETRRRVLLKELLLDSEYRRRELQDAYPVDRPGALEWHRRYERLVSAALDEDDAVRFLTDGSYNHALNSVSGVNGADDPELITALVLPNIKFIPLQVAIGELDLRQGFDPRDWQPPA
jgi:hypothetical protein